jgi:hypothetical protein
VGAKALLQRLRLAAKCVEDGYRISQRPPFGGDGQRS